MDHTVSPTMEEAAGKAAAKLSSTKRKVTASQSQVLNGESIYTISSQPDSSRKETGENNDIFEDEAADSLDLSFSIDKDVSELANPVDYSSTASTPEKLDQVNESLNEVTIVIEVNEHEKPFINGSPGQNDKNDEDLNEIENALTKSGTKRPSMEAESSSGKKMRLNSRNEEMKTESNTESTTTADHSANMTDETSDLFGDSLQLPNTSGYFNELEKSVLEQVATIADKSKDNDVEMLTQGGLSMEHLLKSNNCPLCLKWFDKIVVHVKNCAAKKKVTTDKLFDAIKLQLKQHQEREAMGLPPLVQQPPPKKKNKKKAAVSIPEGYDSSLELAKALSASDSMESPGNLDAESSTETSSVDDNNSRKSAPIFGPASGTSKLKGGSSLLFNRSEEDRERIVTEKVAIVLLHSDEQDNLITETAPAIPSSSKMKENLNKGNLSVNGERIETITTEDCLQSTSLSATKLMNEIDKSPKASFNPENENVIGVNLENVEKPDRYNGPISVRKMNKNSRSLKNNMRKLFEDRVMCDLSVIVEDGYEIEVHKLILRVQCAAILDELVIRFVDDEPKRYIIWNTVPKDVAMAFFEYIYCEDLAKANNLAEEKLKIFMDLVERYDMTGLKFIMKDVQMNNEFDIEEQVRDIDEATTATNSSGDEHNVNVMNVAGNASETATPNKSTPTLDRSKVVKYPLKKRLRNSDPNVSQEVSRNSPASTSISTRRSVLTKSQLSNKKSSKVSLTIDSHSADSTDDIQIIGEEKKDTPNMKPDVITLSDDSDNANDSHDHYGVGNKFKNRIATPVATLVARKKTSGYGSKRIWESSDSESEGGLDVSVPRPSSLSKESSKPSRGSVNPFFHDYWCKETPSTSKAASQFEWEGYKTDYGTYREHNSNKTGSNTKLHKDRDLTNRLGGSNYDFRIGDVLESTSTQSTSTNNWYTQTISEKNSNIEPFGLWSNGLNVNSQEITTGNQRFQPGRESFLYKNKRKRRCSATITRSELDAMEDIAYSAAQEFSDSSRSPVKADTNVSLLNVDDDLFKNVETPDTSATNNAPEITAPAIPSSSKQMNGDDNQGEFTVYPYTQHTPAEKIPLAEVMFEKNENPVPYGSKSSIFHKAENLARPWWNPPQVHEDGGSQAADREVTLNNTLLLPNGNEAPNNKANINAAPMATPFFVPDKGVPLSKTALPLLHELVLKQDEDPEFLQINHQAPDDVLAEAPAGANQYEDLNLVKNGMPTSPTHLIADAPTTKDPTQPSRVTIQQMREAIGAIMKENNVAGAQVGEDPMKVEVDEVPLLNEAAPAPVNFLADAPIHFIADAPVDGNPMKVEVDEVPLVNEAAPAPVDLARIPVRDVRVDQARVNNDVIVEPAHSPRPCFTKMKKAELMQHLERYGVKTNMTCVRARKLLTHIYDFTHQEINVARGKKISAKKEYNRGDLQKMIDDLEGNNSPRKRLISDPEVNRMAGVTENRIPDVGPYPGTSRQEDEMQNQIELTVLEQAMLVGETLSDTYRELLELENKRVVINTEEFECPCCFDNIEPGGGIILKDCVHSICRTCLTGLVESSDEVAIKCPCCTSVIQEREIKEVVAPQIFEKYLSKSLAVTANSIENAFHCKTPDCRGWCIIDDIINQPVNVFNCPRCGIANCIQCQATHPSMNCLEYQNHLAIQAEKDPIAKKSLLYMEKLKKSKKALNCPKCQIVIVKTEGCDWIQCSMCKCEICWATMGPRWGPRGFGDTSGGCRCKLNMGAPCTPKCRNCH